MPRMLGYGSIRSASISAADPDGALAAIIYEVHNTFGERHSYVLPVEDGGAVRQGCAKTFFVSPFLPMQLRYEFHLTPPGETLTLAMRVSGSDGTMLRAALSRRAAGPQRPRPPEGGVLRAGRSDEDDRSHPLAGAAPLGEGRLLSRPGRSADIGSAWRHTSSHSSPMSASRRKLPRSCLN